MPALPKYTHSWNGTVSHVKLSDLVRLQVEYDKTIPHTSIFWLKPPSPLGCRRLVVRARCRNCSTENRNCDRKRDCSNCFNDGSTCEYPNDPINLPRPAPTTARVVPPSVDFPLNQPHPVSQSAPPQILHPTNQSKKSIPEIDPATYLMPYQINGMPIHNGKPLRLPDAGLGSGPPLKKRRITEITKKDKTSWVMVDMAVENTPMSSNKKKAQKLPYIWAENYEEILGAIPSFEAMVNGISVEEDYNRTIFLSNSFWSGNWINAKNEIELTTKRSYTCLESALQPIDMTTGLLVESESVFYEEESLSQMELEYPSDEDVPVQSCSYLEVLPQILANDSKGLQSANVSDTLPRLDDSIANNSQPHRFTQASPHDGATLLSDTSPSSHMPLAQFPIEPDQPKAPKSKPEEIAMLYRTYDEGLPVALVMDATWTPFPFLMDPMYKYTVLGFFHIINIKTRIERMKPVISKNPTAKVRGRMVWSFSLRWTPAGPLDIDVPMDADGRPHSLPNVPWWLCSEDELSSHKASSPMKVLVDPWLVSARIIAWDIMRDALDGEYGVIRASRRSWFCTKCGKLNRTRWNCICRCPCRELAEGLLMPRRAKPIDASSVRDRRRFIPMLEPNCQIPDSVVKYIGPYTDSQPTHFTYTLKFTEGQAIKKVSDTEDLSTAQESETRKLDKGKGKARELLPNNDEVVVPMFLVVDVLFLRNIASLEADADSLFIKFQGLVNMQFEKLESKATAGIFTFRVGPEKPASGWEDGYTNWESAPKPVNDVKGMMVKYARYANKNIADTLSHLSALAWLGESPIKTEINANARDHPVILLCLGADLEIVFEKPGEVPKYRKKPKLKDTKVKAPDLVGSGTNDVEMISIANAREKIWVNGEGKETHKALMASDRLRITLTHGSMLIITGYNVGLTVIRSDFSILLKGYNGY